MPELLGHHFIDDVAGDLEGVEIGRRHRDLVVEKPAHVGLPFEEMRYAAAGPIAGEDDALERGQREISEAVVFEHPRSVERRRYHRRVPPSEQHAVYRRSDERSARLMCARVVIGVVCVL